MAGLVAQEKAMTTADKPQRLPKRFYDRADCVEEAGAFAIRLDGRLAKTRSGKPFTTHSEALGRVVAEEWNAQTDVIDIAAMPVTRFAMTLVDLGERDAPSWRDAILSFLKSDLVCYRAAEPAALVERQAAAWDPLLDWARAALGIDLNACAGVLFIDQPSQAIDAAARLLDAESPARALGVKTAAEIAGSAIIAIALLKEAFPAESLFAASRVDEDFQAERWGLDLESEARAKRLRKDFADAARFLSLV